MCVCVSDENVDPRKNASAPSRGARVRIRLHGKPHNRRDRQVRPMSSNDLHESPNWKQNREAKLRDGAAMEGLHNHWTRRGLSELKTGKHPMLTPVASCTADGGPCGRARRQSVHFQVLAQSVEALGLRCLGESLAESATRPGGESTGPPGPSHERWHMHATREHHK